MKKFSNIHSTAPGVRGTDSSEIQKAELPQVTENSYEPYENDLSIFGKAWLALAGAGVTLATGQVHAAPPANHVVTTQTVDTSIAELEVVTATKTVITFKNFNEGQQQTVMEEALKALGENKGDYQAEKDDNNDLLIVLAKVTIPAVLTFLAATAKILVDWKKINLEIEKYKDAKEQKQKPNTSKAGSADAVKQTPSVHVELDFRNAVTHQYQATGDLQMAALPEAVKQYILADKRRLVWYSDL